MSTSTVSLYIQGDSRVADGTAARIAAAIEKLGYVPRPRRHQQRATLFGLLMEELSLTAFPEAIYGGIIQGIEERARALGYGMLVATIKEGELPQMIQDKQVAGVIILGGCPANDDLARELAARRFPVVLVDNYLIDTPHPIDAIVPDNEWGGYLAFKHLVELGHTRIAIIQGPRKYQTLTDRLWGALRAADDLQISIPLEYLQPSISSGFPNKGYREMKELLALPEPPTAVFAISDRAAFGALDAIREAGLRVPDDISLVGFDDVAHAEHALPPLTTVHYPRSRMGALALTRLVNRIDGRTDLPVRISVPTELIVRASTAPYRKP